MVVAAGQRAELPVEALAAGVVDAGLAPAVTAPVAPAIDEDLERGLVGEHGASLAHGDVVRGVEADGGDVAEGADVLALPGGAERVAAVFDQPQVVLLAESRDRVEIEDVAEGVGDHDGLDPGTVGLLKERGVDLEAGDSDVEEDGHEAVLEDRVDRSREARGDGDDLIAGLELAVAKLGRAQRGERDQVRGGAGVDQRGRPDADKAGKFALKLLRPAAGGEPGVEARLDDRADIFGVDDLATDLDA